MSYQIISDSSCDLPMSLVQEKNIKVVPFYVSFDEKSYYKENEEINIPKFYKKMKENPNVFPKTSLPSVEDYENAFLPYVQNGIDIICLCITTKFSGSYNAASTAKDIILEDYKDAKITIIDSEVVTVLQGLLLLEMVRMQENGLTYEQVIEETQRIKSTGRIIFTVENMDYLIHGGRVGKVMKIAVNALKIRPMIFFEDGEINPIGIVRSRKKSLAKVLDKMKDYFEQAKENPDDYVIATGYGLDKEEAIEFKNEVLYKVAGYSSIKNIDLFQIGATIGVHTGPLPIGVGFIKKYDK